MLSEFVAANRDKIIANSRSRVASRSAPRPTDDELDRGIPLFVDQLTETLRAWTERSDMAPSAKKHGADLHRMQFTVAQVVHDYGDVCQAITQLAIEQEARITPAEFQLLNKCLDDAIAEAVTEFSRLREGSREHAETERLGFLAHELRNKINAAMLAHGILKEGRVGLGGSTGEVLDRNLRGLQELITRSLADVRVESGVQHRERVSVRDLIEEVEAEGAMAANERQLRFTVTPVDGDLVIDADRALLAAALMNLLANAFKFTPTKGHVWLRTSATRSKVTFDVEDECGGLPGGDSEALFVPWAQRSSDKRGLGLGLPLVRRSVHALGGSISVSNKPGKGCTFSVQLLRPAPGAQGT